MAPSTSQHFYAGRKGEVGEHRISDAFARSWVSLHAADAKRRVVVARALTSNGRMMYAPATAEQAHDRIASPT